MLRTKQSAVAPRRSPDRQQVSAVFRPSEKAPRFFARISTALSHVARMAIPRSLARPPITEALVDFRVERNPSFNPENLRSLRARLGDRYPVMEEMRQFEASFEMQAGKPVATKHADRGLLGFKFQSKDGRDVAQFRPDGFTYNRLEPYTAWPEVRAEAVHLWSMFVEIVKPRRIERLALRYINRMAVPKAGNLQDYLEVMPPLFPGAPKAISGYVFRTTTYDPATGDNAGVAGALENAPDGLASQLILDIDVYRVEPTGVDEASFGPILDRLRTVKNTIFFGSITEQNAKRYE